MADAMADLKGLQMALMTVVAWVAPLAVMMDAESDA